MRRPEVPDGTGPFRADTAHLLGFTESERRTALRRGYLVPLRRNVLVTRADREAAGRHPETLHAQDIQALRLAMRRTTLVAAGTSAARIYGLEFLHPRSRP